ncbi:MAG: response regulator [Oceanospirillaceae bacterium]|nr:response regulator [Oceanospirillaceae bacterium]
MTRAQFTRFLGPTELPDILNLYPAGYMLVDNNFKVQDINAYVQDALGFKTPPIGKSLSELLTKASNIMLDTYLTPIALSEGLVEQTQIFLKAADGTSLPMVVNIRRVDAQFYWTMFKCDKRDALIKELKQTTTSLGQSNKELQNTVAKLSESDKKLREKSEQQSEIFAMIGHELRTPLAALQMMADDMHLDTLAPHGEDIRATIDTLLAILDDLRLVMNPEKAEQVPTVNQSPFKLIDTRLRSLAKLVQASGLTLHFTADDKARETVEFKGKLLGQIVTNLVKNAAIHSQGSEIWVDLSVIDNESTARVKLIVEDNGVGICTAKQKRLYEAFVRGNSYAEGTGLGLYIVDQLAKQLDGHIDYSDRTCGGSRFCLTFDIETTHKSSIEETPEHSLKDLNILFAEDQLTLQKLTCKQLELAGSQVEGVYDGAGALNAYAQRGFDIVITDINMPEMNGYVLTQTLREIGYTGPIIGVTAATIGDESRKLLACGADAVLPKPLSMKKLKQTLFKLLDPKN